MQKAFWLFTEASPLHDCIVNPRLSHASGIKRCQT